MRFKSNGAHSPGSRRAAAVAVALALLWPGLAGAATLKIDREHTDISFRVRHLFSKVTGHFREFDGTIELDETNLAASKVSATIKASSVDTNVEARDKDLRSKRFFDVAAYPAITFQTSGVTVSLGTKGKVKGTLTMHGVKREVVLDTEFLGKGKDPWGNLRYAFHASTTINRKDFGMKWNEAVETGGVLVGDDVEITLDIEAVPQSK